MAQKNDMSPTQMPIGVTVLPLTEKLMPHAAGCAASGIGSAAALICSVRGIAVRRCAGRIAADREDTNAAPRRGSAAAPHTPSTRMAERSIERSSCHEMRNRW